MTDKTWGGARAGAGRKPAADPKDKRVQMVITIDRETRDKLRWVYTHRNIRPGKMVDLLVERHLNDILFGD